MNPVPPSRLTLPKLPEPTPTLLDFLAERFPHVPRDVWRDRFDRGRVRTSDGAVLRPDTSCVAGTVIVYDREVVDEPTPDQEPAIVYRDERILVVDKPPYLPVPPAGAYVQRSLLAMVRRATGLASLTPIHRLDRDTSGLVLFTIDEALRPDYHRLFAERAVEREYLALAQPPCDGRSAWTVSNRLGLGEPWFRRTIVDGPVNAITHVELLRVDDALALYRLRPETGQKHQLRVHMALLGLPIVNDRLYPALDRQAYPEDEAHALRLCATRLAFRDPVTGRPVVVGSSWPGLRSLPAWSNRGIGNS